MKKSKTLPPVILFLALLTQTICAQTPGESQAKQNNDYGIDLEKSYSGIAVSNLINELMTAAAEEIDVATDEAYAEGYKQGLLVAKPEMEYWKSMYIGLKTDTDKQIKKLKGERWLFALGGVGIGFLGGAGFGFGFQLRL